MKVKIPIGIFSPKRYVCFEIKGDAIRSSELIKNLIMSTRGLFGILGLSKTRLILKHFEDKRGVIETTSADLPHAISALAFAVYSLGENRSFRVVKISGTMRKALLALES